MEAVRVNKLWCNNPELLANDPGAGVTSRMCLQRNSAEIPVIDDGTAETRNRSNRIRIISMLFTIVLKLAKHMESFLMIDSSPGLSSHCIECST